MFPWLIKIALLSWILYIFFLTIKFLPVVVEYNIWSGYILITIVFAYLFYRRKK